MAASQRPLTIALNRGDRILSDSLALLARAGIEPDESIERSRKLVFGSRCGRARLVIMRGSDVPTFVEYGAADLGVAGKDTLLEHGGTGFYERLDLRIAPCRLMTAMPVGFREPEGRPLRVATKFVRIAREHYANSGRAVEIIPLSGAMEIAPLMGLADCIVDIVETGTTLKANGLEAGELITESTARVIVNRASLKVRLVEIESLLADLRSAVGD